jgi:hypothetical protein
MPAKDQGPENIISITQVCETIPHITSACRKYNIRSKDVWIFWDMDLTLGVPDSLNSPAFDPFFEELLKAIPLDTKISPELAKKKRVKQALKICHAAQRSSRSKPVEDYALGTVDIVHGLQKRGFMNMLLTARSKNIYECTLRQLNKDLNIDFSSSNPMPQYVYPQNILMFNNELDEKGECSYFNGSLCCGNHDKGEKIVNLITEVRKENGEIPAMIVMVDDKVYNAVAVQKALKFHPEFSNIIFLGFEYAACKDDVSRFKKEFSTHFNDVFRPMIIKAWAHIAATASRPTTPLIFEQARA